VTLVGVLSSQQIRTLIEGPSPLITGFVDLDAQIQPNGVDLTLASLDALTGAGRIGRSNDERILADTRELVFDSGGYVQLTPGAYVARLNETVSLPANVMAIAKPRSSLLRNGVAVHNAVWDAGYTGRSQVQLVVYNPAGFTLAKDARIVQIVFMTLDATTDDPYAGRYQEEATGTPRQAAP
jgi:dUTP pyrophosphatase